MRWCLATVLTFLLSPIFLVAAETPSGTVVDESGQALSSVQVERVGTNETTLTDSEGAFFLDALHPPAQLRFTSPGYIDLLVDVRSDNAGSLTVTLEKQPILRDEITVAAQPLRDRAPVTLAASSVAPSELAVPASTPAELAAHTSSVSENGQGGLFQVLSVRGVSRHRVRTLLAGVPLAAERRAGVSASFVDPRLLGGSR